MKNKKKIKGVRGMRLVLCIGSGNKVRGVTASGQLSQTYRNVRPAGENPQHQVATSLEDIEAKMRGLLASHRCADLVVLMTNSDDKDKGYYYYLSSSAGSEIKIKRYEVDDDDEYVIVSDKEGAYTDLSPLLLIEDNMRLPWRLALERQVLASLLTVARYLV